MPIVRTATFIVDFADDVADSYAHILLLRRSGREVANGGVVLSLAEHPPRILPRLVQNVGRGRIGPSARPGYALCTTTAAREPILEGAWLAPGAHINAVGACFAAARELDTAAVARARLIVDRRESTLAESGDFLIAKAEGAFGDDHIAGELGDVLLGTLVGREGDDQITLFDSLGIAVEDLAAAHYIYTQAIALGGGALVPLGA